MSIKKSDVSFLTQVPSIMNQLSETFHHLQVELESYYEDLADYWADLIEENPDLEIDAERDENSEIFFIDSVENECPWEDSEIEITYRIDLFNDEENPLWIEYGYYFDESQHVICFELFNYSANVIRVLKDQIETQIADKWKYGVTINSSIYLEFDITEDLSSEQIKACAEDFKTYLLTPATKEYLNQMKH